jgi:tetratricopeptide (TPR) repeat protein
MAERRYERTEAEYRRAMELNPSLADVRANWASTANRLGLAQEGVGSMELAMRLNPNHPVWYSWFYGAALYGASRFEDAATALRSAAAHTVVSRLYLAASLHQLGRHDEARSEVAAARDQVPEISVAMLEQIEVYRDVGDEARLSEALRGAGLPAS